jgi:CheY-like chemotaxis protein
MDHLDDMVPTRVLLVDDDIQPLELRAEVLRMNGFSVISAPGGVEAMAIMAASPEGIDVAVLDYQMPIMNGGVLAKRLRSLCPDVKIILHSGAVDIPCCAMTSVDAFIPKGDGMATLIGQIVAFVRPGVPTRCSTGEDPGCLQPTASGTERISCSYQSMIARSAAER